MKRKILFYRTCGVHGHVSRYRPVAAARADLIFLKLWIRQFHGDGAPAAIWIWLRVVAEKVQMRQVFPDGSEGVALILPGLREIRLAACACRHPSENRGRSRVQ